MVQHEQGEAWTLADAKARFSEVVTRAVAEGPQSVTRHGNPAVVVVSAEEWQRKTRRRGTLAEFFADSPLRGSGLEIGRSEAGPRPIDL
ncbi:type II toxin-antitoxin system Phd/YefM family antitoxin [soil metagenome]